MPSLTITVTAAQVPRIEVALRNSFDADPTKTLAELGQAFVFYHLKNLVENYELSVRKRQIEDQLGPISSL